MVRTEQSAALFAEAEAYAPGGVHTSIRNVEPRLVFNRAEGARIWDADGNEYLDYHAAFGPFILGHVHPIVVQRVEEALWETDLYGVGATPQEIALAKKVVEHVPSIEQVLFTNAGSEATFHALRVARAHTGREKIIKFQGCYHGWHDAVLRNVISTPDMIGKRDFLSAGMMEETADATLICTFNDADEVEDTIRAHEGEIAAIIVEPIPHNIGCVRPEPGFLEALRALCDAHGIVLVFDEVITGFRHDLGGFQKVAGVTPDVTTLGKAIANGFPLAAVGGKKEIMSRFNTTPGGDTFFAGTYNGHAVGTVAALATIEIMETQGVHEEIFRLGDRIRTGLSEVMTDAGIPAVVEGFGSVFVTYFMDGPARNFTDLLQNDAEFFIRYRQECIKRGVFKLPMNIKRNHISFAHTDADIDRTLQVAEDAIHTLLRQGVKPEPSEVLALT
ncbi:MAG: glutamate-1-semialdehyde 2,1-aminomutase [Chloroflexi bacterium]|nr:glutamate-1-semialdehyde 2,1-aminomutase [Chloroflexota bacterium]